jgi:hypothetical protein
MKKILGSLLILFFALLNNASSQYIHFDSVRIDKSTSPPKALIVMRTGPYYFDRIVQTSLNDLDNTQVFKIYFKRLYCNETLNILFFDTLHQFNAVFPFAVKLYGILDTSSLCPNFPANPVYVDSFYRSAAQISVLPVIFSYFNIKNIQDKSILNWGVSEETNIKSYTVQRANDFSNFEDIETIYTNNSKEYKWLDTKPLVGLNYYRIKLLSNDGKAIYSSIQKIIISNLISEINVYPNPAKDVVNIFSNDIINEIKIFNQLGQLQMSKQVNQKSITLDTHSLASGIYSLQITNSVSGKIETQKLIINK